MRSRGMRHCGEKDRERRNNAPQCAVSAAAVANDANAATKIPLGMKSSSLQTTERRFAEPPSNVMALMLKQRARLPLQKILHCVLHLAWASWCCMKMWSIQLKEVDGGLGFIPTAQGSQGARSRNIAFNLLVEYCYYVVCSPSVLLG